MNLGEIEAKLYDRFGFNQNPGSDVTRRFRGYINDVHKQVLGQKGSFEKLRRAILTTSSVASSPFMVLPQAATRIDIVSDRTNQRSLTEVTLADIRASDPGLTMTSSIPYGYCILNYSSPVALDPSDASSLFVKSDSASDGSGLSVTVEGVITGGYIRRASIALNGLTAVNISSVIPSWISVTKFFLSGAAAGNVTLNEDSGAGTELARITPGYSSARYTRLHLTGTPASAITYYCDVSLRIGDLVNRTDEPLLPDDYHFIIEAGAMMAELEKREKLGLWKIQEKRWSDGLSDLKGHLSRVGGVSFSGQRANGVVPWSQLSGAGLLFPAGS